MRRRAENVWGASAYLSLYYDLRAALYREGEVYKAFRAGKLIGRGRLGEQDKAFRDVSQFRHVYIWTVKYRDIGVYRVFCFSKYYKEYEK